MSEAPRPTRLLVVLSIFLVGTYPPLLFLTFAGLTGSRPAVVIPAGLLVWLTIILMGLWQPAVSAWASGVGFLVVALVLLLSLLPAALEQRSTTLLAAAAFLYYLLSLVIALGLRRSWRAWRDQVGVDAALKSRG